MNKEYEEYVDIIKYLSEIYDEFSFYPNRKEIINIEMFFVFLYIRRVRPEVIFESGYWKGRSSLIILEIIKRENIKCDYYIACIIKEPYVYFDYSNFNLLYGKGQHVIKTIVEKQHGKKIIALIDGPKFKHYKRCKAIYDLLFQNFNTQVIFQHDLERLLDRKNHQTYYNKKVDNKKYDIGMIDIVFVNKYLSLMDKNNNYIENLGIIYNRSITREDVENI